MRANVASRCARGTNGKSRRNALVVVVFVRLQRWMLSGRSVRILRVRLPRIDVHVDLSDAGKVVDDVMMRSLGDGVRVGDGNVPIDRNGE